MSGPISSRRTTLRDEGYEFIGVGQKNGWRPIAGWGRDGWDLGSWPLVVVLFRERTGSGVPLAAHLEPPYPGVYERAIYVEGDITIEAYATSEDRERATDETAFFYWRAAGNSWIEGYPPGSEPDHLRGPYRRAM